MFDGCLAQSDWSSRSNSSKFKARSRSITNVEIVDRRLQRTLPDLYCWVTPALLSTRIRSVVSLEATPTVTPSNARHWMDSGSHFFLTNSIVPHIQLPQILFNAGILSYLGFTIKLLWKLAKMFPGQPHAVTIGFVVPSVATFIFVQYYSPERVQAPKERTAILKVAVDATILAGAFICTFIVWWILAMVGELMAVMFVAFHFGTLYLLGT
ncbi:hypothetical protein EV359DRAFT_68777 [Lentinula novae-zelandiae]|nr:hypothetical protein EV359DRAFT_68777 [Lentinula novae-zelandiae]